MVTTRWRSVHGYDDESSVVRYNIIKCFFQVNACKFTTT